MGLKVKIFTFAMVVIIANIVLFFFALKINILEIIVNFVGSTIGPYAPIKEPLTLTLFVALIFIAVVGLIFLKIFSEK